MSDNFYMFFFRFNRGTSKSIYQIQSMSCACDTLYNYAMIIRTMPPKQLTKMSKLLSEFILCFTCTAFGVATMFSIFTCFSLSLP
jgi:hypothetical protein